MGDNNAVFKSRLLTILVTLFCPFTLKADAAAATAGSNGQIFAVMCKIVNAATIKPQETPNPTLSDHTKKAAPMISVFLKNPEVLLELAAAENIPQEIAKPGSKGNKFCTTLPQHDCADAAAYLKSTLTTAAGPFIKALTEDSPLRQRINETATELAQMISDYDKTNLCEQTGSYEDNMKAALTGDKPNSNQFRMHKAQTNRQTTCGLNSATAGTSAGKSIADDLLCLCAADTGSQTGDVKVCSWASTQDVTFSAGDQADQGAAWEAIKTECKKTAASVKQPNAAELRATIQTIRNHIAVPKGQSQKSGYLGTVSSGGANGHCDAQSTAGAGACVYYGTTGTTANEPGWLQKLDAAANCLEEAQTSALDKKATAKSIELLNATLTNLLHLNMQYKNAATTTKPSQGASTSTLTEAAHQKCRNAKDDQAECEKLAKEGCVFNKDGEKGKKCELSEESKQAVEKKEERKMGKLTARNMTIRRIAKQKMRG
uniref:Variant surface glycoprotein 1125.4261 n=1 Tax=Trypanosoma brucei TaxID=5691 RepID=A0A1J0RAH2_9TRYP|nr:variant surface glycoprotein 1125.4261 [Trypanosoma brucei]